MPIIIYLQLLNPLEKIQKSKKILEMKKIWNKILLIIEYFVNLWKELYVNISNYNLSSEIIENRYENK